MRFSSCSLVCVLMLAACGDASGPADTSAFTAKVKLNGATTTTRSDSTQYQLICDLNTGLCDHLSVVFYAKTMVPGYQGPFALFLSANNVPSQNFRPMPGTYPFNDITPFDIFVELDTGTGGEYWQESDGTLTIAPSDSMHFTGSFHADLVKGNAGLNLPPISLTVKFDVPTH